MHPGGAEPWDAGWGGGGGGRGGRGRTPDLAGDPQPTLGGALSSAPSYARIHGVGEYWHGRNWPCTAPRCHRCGREAPAPGSTRPQNEGAGGGEGFAPLAFPDPPSTSDELLALHSRVIDLKLSPTDLFSGPWSSQGRGGPQG